MKKKIMKVSMACFLLIFLTPHLTQGKTISHFWKCKSSSIAVKEIIGVAQQKEEAKKRSLENCAKKTPKDQVCILTECHKWKIYTSEWKIYIPSKK